MHYYVVDMLSVGLCLLLCHVNSLHANDVSVTVQDVWQGRYHLKMTVTASEDVNGWEVVLHFSSPITKMDVSYCYKMQLLVCFLFRTKITEVWIMLLTGKCARKQSDDAVKSVTKCRHVHFLEFLSSWAH